MSHIFRLKTLQDVTRFSNMPKSCNKKTKIEPLAFGNAPFWGTLNGGNQNLGILALLRLPHGCDLRVGYLRVRKSSNPRCGGWNVGHMGLPARHGRRPASVWWSFFGCLGVSCGRARDTHRSKSGEVTWRCLKCFEKCWWLLFYMKKCLNIEILLYLEYTGCKKILQKNK